MSVPNYGFAIDLRTCIGCHACTIACKAEHDIPIGVNRCWVKSVETGVFPDARRFFFPVLCNQCDAAPCVTICPTRALYRRRDGIVDLNGDSCIGCRACMAACPYDQLFIDPNTRTAEKCNFCANRVENELLPSCVSVCPTQCRIFGDLDDPTSDVAMLLQREATSVRKPEKGTGPKVFYVAADDRVIQPEIAARPFLFKDGQVHMRPLGATIEQPDDAGGPRVDYDAPHAKAWGADMVIYLAAKGVSCGAMLVSALAWAAGVDEPLTRFVGPAIALACIAITGAVLTIDLQRPERFYYILTRSNWRSWLVWGAYLLAAHGAICALWMAAAIVDAPAALSWLAWPAALVSVATACYTGLLFAQARARDLWQGSRATIGLLPQAVAQGAGVLLVSAWFTGTTNLDALIAALVWSTIAHAAIVALETTGASHGTRHHELAIAAVLRGPFARVFWTGAVGAPIACLLVVAAFTYSAYPLAGLLGLLGAASWDYVWVEAGQSVPVS